MEKPLVSICIPTYNGGEFIKETIESILAQSYDNLEIIITDDKSTDNTAEIVSSFEDKRIIFIRNEKNLGFIGNWNKCLSLTQGKYMKVVCHDDILLEDTIKKQVEIMETNSNVSVVTGASTVVNTGGQAVMERRAFRKDTVMKGRDFAKMTILKARNLYGEPCMHLYRKIDMDNGNIIYDPESGYCVDWDMAMMLSYEGDVYYCSDCLAKFRISKTSETSSTKSKDKKKKTKEQLMRLFDKHNEMGKFGFGSGARLFYSALNDAYFIARHLIIKIKA